MSLASPPARTRKRVDPVVVVDAKVAVAEIVEIAEAEDVGRTKVETRISRMTMIAKLASWVPVRAKRSDKVVDVRDVVVAIVESVAVIANVGMVAAKSAVTAVIVASRASVVSAKSVHRSLVSANNVSRSWSTKRLAST
jgi:hypothetical protein